MSRNYEKCCFCYSASRSSKQRPSIGQRIHQGAVVRDLGPHITGKFEPEGEPVLIEFLTYEKSWSSHEDELLERVNAIASLRSRSVSESIFPILRCRGYYPEITRDLMSACDEYLAGGRFSRPYHRRCSSRSRFLHNQGSVKQTSERTYTMRVISRPGTSLIGALTARKIKKGEEKAKGRRGK